jgi:hypothetical protein
MRPGPGTRYEPGKLVTLVSDPFASAVATTSWSNWSRFGVAQLPGWRLMRWLDLGVKPFAVTVIV